MIPRDDFIYKAPSGNINFDLFDFNPFGSVQVNFGFAALAVVAYIVLWVILPVSYANEEDKEIKKLNEIKDLISQANNGNKTAMNEYLAQARYQESIRDKADEVLREVLASIEGEAGHEN